MNPSQAELKSDNPKVDHFGFIISPKLHKNLSDSKQEVFQRSKMKRENARLEKWRKMLPKLELLIEKRDNKLKKRIRKGIPDSLRGKIWPLLAKINKQKEKSGIDYQGLLLQETSSIEDIIKDIHRTYPAHPFFAIRDGLGQKSLENVLKALSLTYKEVGYCQGLNFICALLVMYCNDEEAYWIMNSLMEQYNLEEYYRDLITVKKPLFVLDELIKQFFPKLGKHFAKYAIEGLCYATGWVMTLYSNFLPFHLVVRLFDAFLFEKFKIVYRIGLAVIKIKEKKLLQFNSMENILIHLRNFDEPEFHDDDLFLKIAFKIKLKRKDIQKIQARYVSK